MSQWLGLALGVVAGSSFVALWARLRVLPQRQEAELEQTVRMVARAVELRAPRYAADSARVLEIADQLAQLAGLDSVHRKRLRLAVWLRDMGLTDVPYAQLNRVPEFDWTPAERAFFDQSGKRAADFLAQIPCLQELAPILSERHQNFEPGMTREGRILRIAADYVWSLKHQGELVARERIRNGAGTAYDPSLVAGLLGTMTENHVRRSSDPIRTGT